MVELDFGGVKENVITRKEFTVEKAQKTLKNEVVVSLGYGIQGRAQSLNMRDNGIKVIIGQEKSGVHLAFQTTQMFFPSGFQSRGHCI
jgi:ketol-acid reductoisomerase